MKYKAGHISLFEPSSIPRISSAMLETRIDTYNYNIRNELISAGKLVGRDACPAEAFGEGRAPIAPQSPASTTEYAYQYGFRRLTSDFGGICYNLRR